MPDSISYSVVVLLLLLYLGVYQFPRLLSELEVELWIVGAVRLIFLSSDVEADMTGVGTDDDIPLGERKTVTDFCYLLDKSKQLFNGLRLVLLCLKVLFDPKFFFLYYTLYTYTFYTSLSLFFLI